MVNVITKILADELKNINTIVNSVDPVWVKIDMGGLAASLTINEGIDTLIWLATADPN